MANERDLAEAAALGRRRLVQAFGHGSDRGSLLDAPRPNRAVVAGVGVALLCGIGAGISGVVRGGPVADWDRDGNVVLVEETGRRYLMVDGTARPVLNDTTLRLAGADREPVQVSEGVLARHAVGPTVGNAEFPYAVPRLLTGHDWDTCVRPGGLAVVIGSEAHTEPERPDAVLVRDDSHLWLVAEGQRYQTDRAALDALGHLGVPARPVPPGWLATVPTGPPMHRLLDGVSTPKLFVDQGGDTTFVETGGVLRPVANHTTLRLVFGPAVPPPVAISPNRLRTMPRGELLGQPQWPDSPPALARDRQDAWACVSGATSRVRLLRSLPTSGRRATSAAPPGGAEVWQSARVGLLVATTEQAREPSEENPAWLVAEGSAFPVTSPDVLGALGYDPDQLLVAPSSWVHLLPEGPPLQRITT